MSISEQARLGAEIKRRRVEQGLTLALLSSRASISATYLSKVEHGRADVGLPVLRRIAAALGTPLGVLFGDVPTLSPKALACGRLFDAVDEELREAVHALLRVLVRHGPRGSLSKDAVRAEKKRAR